MTKSADQTKRVTGISITNEAKWKLREVAVASRHNVSSFIEHLAHKLHAEMMQERGKTS